MPTNPLELKHTFCLIGELDSEIESEINPIVEQICSAILIIPRIGYRMGP